jgi:tripartite-type tricarboxylate transporter receptor subunit TctC
LSVRPFREITAVLASPEGKAAMVSQGVDTDTNAPESLTARMRDEIAKWRAVVAKADIKPE